MSTYDITFKNKTTQGKVVQFVVYQEYPKVPGLKSVAWKQAGVYDNVQASVRWKISYFAVISDYHDDGQIGVYNSKQLVSANLKDQFDVKDLDVRKETVHKNKFIYNY